MTRRGAPYSINFNDGINILTAHKAAPPVYHRGAPQFLQLSGNHEPFAARTTHRHGSYFSFWQIPTICWYATISCGTDVRYDKLCHWRSSVVLQEVR
jgi:hypothetical protein